jgi:predicted transcriptional regulator
VTGPWHITQAESVVLGALWRHGPLTPARLQSEVKAVQPWAGATIKTLLARLIHKRIVRSERHDGVIRYRPLVEREAYVEAEVRALLDRLFDGDPAALVALLEGNRPAPEPA